MKRLITIQDVSCVGRCSLTVALPIISAMGVECAVLPTAVLSTHTAFPSFTFHDLTDEIAPISEQYKKLGITFDAIYTGYLGSLRQIDLVRDFFAAHGGENTLVIVDPAMADNGKLYPCFDETFARKMGKLCATADVVLPNLTEASYILGIPYNPNPTEEEVRDILVRLTEKGAKCAMLTGIGFDDAHLGAYLYDSTTKTFDFYANERLPKSFHGTGDVFASIVSGALMRGKSISEAMKIAVDITLLAMKKTLADPDARFYGVNFEEAIPELTKRV